MQTKIIILLFMIFCHIVDDYYLQGWLASGKQKAWWSNQDEMYKNDYIMALIEHAFSWSFMINLPILIYVVLFGGKFYPLLFVINMIIHAYVDNLKANKKTINLIQDQSIHLIQVLGTWLLWGFLYA